MFVACFHYRLIAIATLSRDVSDSLLCPLRVHEICQSEQYNAMTPFRLLNSILFMAETLIVRWSIRYFKCSSEAFALFDSLAHNGPWSWRYVSNARFPKQALLSFTGGHSLFKQNEKYLENWLLLPDMSPMHYGTLIVRERYDIQGGFDYGWLWVFVIVCILIGWRCPIKLRLSGLCTSVCGSQKLVLKRRTWLYIGGSRCCRR